MATDLCDPVYTCEQSLARLSCYCVVHSVDCPSYRNGLMRANAFDTITSESIHPVQHCNGVIVSFKSISACLIGVHRPASRRLTDERDAAGRVRGMSFDPCKSVPSAFFDHNKSLDI